jgi:hypothetical protein
MLGRTAMPSAQRSTHYLKAFAEAQSGNATEAALALNDGTRSRVDAVQREIQSGLAGVRAQIEQAIQTLSSSIAAEEGERERGEEALRSAVHRVSVEAAESLQSAIAALEARLGASVAALADAARTETARVTALEADLAAHRAEMYPVKDMATEAARVAQMAQESTGRSTQYWLPLVTASFFGSGGHIEHPASPKQDACVAFSGMMNAKRSSAASFPACSVPALLDQRLTLLVDVKGVPGATVKAYVTDETGDEFSVVETAFTSDDEYRLQGNAFVVGNLIRRSARVVIEVEIDNEGSSSTPELRVHSVGLVEE